MYAQSDGVIESIHLLTEASETIGREIMFNYRHLPASTLEQIYATAEKKGIDRNHVNMMLHNPSHAENRGVRGDRTSIMGADVIDGAIQHSLEVYDKATDEAILASDDIVKTYNAAINAHFEEARKYAERLDKAKATKVAWNTIEAQLGVPATSKAGIAKEAADSGHLGAALIIGNILEALKPLELSESDMRKIICEAAYQPSDNPEEIKAIINARIKYNNLTIKLLKEMLQFNYQLLGITKDQAMILTEQLESEDQKVRQQGIKMTKEQFAKNIDQFRKGKTIIDGRPVGLGVFFTTNEDVGIYVEEADRADRLVQLLMRYDAVISAHGGDDSDARYKLQRELYDKLLDSSENERDRLRKELTTLESISRSELDAVTALRNGPDMKAIRRLKNSYKLEIEFLEDDLKDFCHDYSDELTDLKIKVSSAIRERDRCAAELEKIVDSMSGNKKLSKAVFESEYDEDDLKWAQEALERATKKLHDSQEELAKYQKRRSDQVTAIKKLVLDLKKEALALDKKYKSGDMTEEEANAAFKELYENFKKREKHITELKVKIDRNTSSLFGPSANVDIQSRRLAKKHSISNWTIQKVKTLSGGPFEDVNDLVRQLIKEGFKNIFITACNPGGHKLADDIVKNKSVKVSFSKTSLLVEDAVDYNNMADVSDFDTSNLILEHAETYLKDLSESIGLDYKDDHRLNEMAAEYDLVWLNTAELNEGTIANIWARIVELVKKAIGFLVSLFKKMIELVKKIIGKIIAFFKNVFDKLGGGRRLTKKVKSGRILVESARSDKYDANSWDDMKKATVAACESISRKIDHMERKQLDNMKELERYSEKQAKAFHENAHPELDKVTALLFS